MLGECHVLRLGDTESATGFHFMLTHTATQSSRKRRRESEREE